MECKEIMEENFFSYDPEYAKANKVRRSKNQRMFAVYGALVVSVALFFASLFLGETPAFDDPNLFPLCAALILVLLALVPTAPLLVRRSFKPYLLAVNSAFLKEEDGWWYIALEPKQTSAAAAELNRAFRQTTWETAHDRDASLELVNNARRGLKVQYQYFKKPTVRCMKDVYTQKQGRMLLLTFHDENGKNRTLKVPDAFPGLPESLNAKNR